eukprot:Em0006g599a
MKIAMLLASLVAVVHSDLYLHNPRGSNNRLAEANRERDNANRLFDSQNNDRGGYNAAGLYYYSGSVLPIEWTNQHSCGDQNANCEIIIQYMCGPLVRDGTSTTTIPENPTESKNLVYGMHESYNYYQDCKLRNRNLGLFTADRKLNGDSAIYTRQNEAGTRRGYECPEERDYYPYWHPTPWVDIAVLTNDLKRCEYYRSESANVKSRYACVGSKGTTIPNNDDDCVAAGGVWTEFPPQNGLEAPVCIKAPWSRDNHLGNGKSVPGHPNYYNWTIPNTPSQSCVLRVRYNISTGDYDGWSKDVNGQVTVTGTVTANGNAQSTTATNPTVKQASQTFSTLDLKPNFSLNRAQAFGRGYVFRQNPVIMPFNNIPGLGFQLAINTNQFGRTFQDRSHSFSIVTRPSNLADTPIYNLNVRGKRGNIVQVFPAVEYDFVPDILIAPLNSYVHIQTMQDRVRLELIAPTWFLLRPPNYVEGNRQAGPSSGHWGNSYPAHLDSPQTLLGLPRADRQSLAVLDIVQRGNDMSELNDAGTYFDLGLKKVTQLGTYYYMCTRNNNFSNRDQKSKIIIQEGDKAAPKLGGTLTLSNRHKMKKTFSKAQPFSLEHKMSDY